MDRHPLGRVISVRGSVIDVAFPDGELPAINEALEIEWDRPWRLTVEVQSHLDRTSVRTVALQTSSGLRRGIPVRRSGEPLRVPVGEAVLGRVLNALGDPVDHGPPLPEDLPRWPIHRPAPTLAQQTGARELFETGIKVIDLLAPLARGGKAGMFGGAGVGKTVLIMELIHTMVETYTGHLGVRRHRRTLARGARAVAGDATVGCF